MPRLVTKTANKPRKVGDFHICMCGLSEGQPFCDKSHIKTEKEDKEKLYWYVDGIAEEVISEDSNCAESCGNGSCGNGSCGSGGCGHCEH